MKKAIKEEAGISLVESLIAMVILLFGLLAMAQVLAFCVVGSKTFGRDSGKTTASAHDKMEELSGLSFTDTTTNVTVAPPYPATGTGLTQGGSVYPSSVVTGYADYLNGSGARTTASGALYRRQWQVINSSATSKTIIVSVTSTKSFKNGTAPTTVLVTQKTQ